MISDEERDQVRAATDLVSLVSETVVLKQRGADDFWGCCPFHHEKSPSFHLRSSSGLWHCFGCGEGGDVFDYVKKRENLDFADAVRFLAARAGIELHEDYSGSRGPKKTRLSEALLSAEEFYQINLMRSGSPDAQNAREYLASRDFSSAVCKKWGIGFAPASTNLAAQLLQKGFSAKELEVADLGVSRGGRLRDRFFNRVMFPITNELGSIIGFGGRVLGDGKPKYLNSKDSSIWHKSKNLYGLDKAKDAIVSKSAVIIVEGYTDCISLHEAGFSNTVAVLGTALTQDHIKLLSRYRPRKIISLFDGDEAGQRAAKKVSQFVDKTEADLLVCVLPENLDPAEYLEKFGREALAKKIENSVPVMDFVLKKEFEGMDEWSPGMRVSKLREIADLFAPLSKSPLLSTYVATIADLLNISQDDVFNAINVAEKKAASGRASFSQAPFSPALTSSYAPVSAGFSPSAPAPAPSPTSASASVPGSAPVTSPGGGVEGGVEASSHAAPGVNPGFLTKDEELRLKMERELLSLLAENRAVFSENVVETKGISWLDAVDENIFSIIQSAPQSENARELIATITAKVPDAAKILASAEIEDQSESQVRVQADFLVKNILFLQKQAEFRRIKSRLGLTSKGIEEEGEELLRKASSLQKEIAELQKEITNQF